MPHIAIVLSPGFEMMCFAAISAFEAANVAAGEKQYVVTILSERGGLVKNTLGAGLETEPFIEPGSFDTVIAGGLIKPVPSSPGLISYFQAAGERCRRVASICTGAFILAEAGLLDGRRTTTHWFFARELQSRFPQVLMEEDRIFIIDGHIWTSAGMTAGIDLALGMIEKDYGAELARSAAQLLVVYHRRAGGQSQHSMLLTMNAKSDRIQSALLFARQNLRLTLSVEDLAEVANLSPRQFSRAFRAETGQTPARAVENLRVEAARLMLEQSRHTLDEIAIENGFTDRERMRRAFLRTFGQPPQAIRRAARFGAEA
ncbi:GlxA family transcriptional regulator [Nguyenibacter vanlangensis]|uniref:GlxA family transcriptional regulator n=1 Tax=Nguyenibacter vanlangensis TaxID=1216886 RepID=A0A7Y7M5M2_9PROT|nr:GlxA family transcriptional regulator [Nguyenibacter vanlangensis]NVN09638.1 GlxA family transcriptional regulator [Nguyenibacter vanlangensis]